MEYSSSYGERVVNSFGFNGIGQQFGVKGYLGKKITLYANIAFGFASEKNIANAQQIEIIHDFIGGKQKQGYRFGAGLGASNDFNSVKSMLSRFTLTYEASHWKTSGNILLQKAFASNHNQISNPETTNTLSPQTGLTVRAKVIFNLSQ